MFSDPGATATDSVDGVLDVVVTGEVGSEVGAYTLTYSATDAGGNTASVDRSITVVEVDTGGGSEESDVFIIEKGSVADIWGGNDLLSFFGNFLTNIFF